MSRSGRSACALLTAALIGTVAGCAADSGGEGEASCAFEVSYEGRTYKDVANVDFTVTDKLGTATLPPCDDTGSREEAETEETEEPAYAVKGLSPETAIAVGSSPDEAVFVVSYSGTRLPPEVQELIDKP
ncbi:DUF6281 family protein [Streptomyces sp. SH5]|uniref:DUF6281 family protein n=1 Tax=Streptomyces sp. SH5 TaxID=3041765 RepID=UPI0024781FAC|nr:DUF6281 family protein [Streptomyces sp. SH5]WGP10227.1 DUF6281 family protein [Streptomyces sp. SH5]